MSGLIYVFTGEGKGKTSAALGVAIRAAGYGKKVAFFQFMKEDAPKTGEFKILQLIDNIDVYRFGASLLNKKDLRAEETERRVNEGLDLAKDMLEKSRVDILILDELNVTLNKGLAKLQKIREILEYKKNGIDIIITGRNAPEEILEVADLATEMRKIKHPFDKGIKAKKGLDY